MKYVELINTIIIIIFCTPILTRSGLWTSLLVTCNDLFGCACALYLSTLSLPEKYDAVELGSFHSGMKLD